MNISTLFAAYQKKAWQTPSFNIWGHPHFKWNDKAKIKEILVKNKD